MSRVLIAAIAVAGLAFGAAPYVAAAEVAGTAPAVPAAKRIQGILISVSDKKIVIGRGREVVPLHCSMQRCARNAGPTHVA
jgi:hypothetical protein